MRNNNSREEEHQLAEEAHHYQRQIDFTNMDPFAIVSGSDGEDNDDYDSFDDEEEDDTSMEDESDHHSPFDENDNDDHEAPDNDMIHNNDSLLYDPNLDDEDEAWVYKHMRGGLQENIPILVTTKNQNYPKQTNNHKGKDKEAELPVTATDTTQNYLHQHQQNQEPQKQQKENQKQRIILPVYQPRKSDAILSCPCCFQIVCMDCQRHEFYINQYRAMFVMNIGVSWDITITPEQQDTPVEKNNVSTKAKMNQRHVIQQDEDTSQQQNHQEIYYSVYCNTCHTVVAALNMDDEVYHFFGCLASAA